MKAKWSYGEIVFAAFSVSIGYIRRVCKCFVCVCLSQCEHILL